MESVKVIVVGFGDRGAAYTKYALDNPDRLKVIAVVDPNPFRRELAKEKFALETCKKKSRKKQEVFLRNFASKKCMTKSRSGER